MSQGCDGSPGNFLDPVTCDDILADLRGANGSLPTFESDAGTAPPELEAAVACERSTQTSPTPTQDRAIPVRTVQDNGT